MVSPWILYLKWVVVVDFSQVSSFFVFAHWSAFNLFVDAAEQKGRKAERAEKRGAKEKNECGVGIQKDSYLKMPGFAGPQFFCAASQRVLLWCVSWIWANAGEHFSTRSKRHVKYGFFLWRCYPWTWLCRDGPKRIFVVFSGKVYLLDVDNATKNKK